MIAETLIHFLVMQRVLTENGVVFLGKFLLKSHLLFHELKLLLFLEDHLGLIISYIQETYIARVLIVMLLALGNELLLSVKVLWTFTLGALW